MDVELNEEQAMLADSVRRMLADTYSFEQREAIRKSAGGYSPGAWSNYASLGLLGLPFAEADGGLGGGGVETMVVMEALGRALALEPYLATVVLAGGVLRHGASAAQRGELVPAIAAGELKLALAHTERQSRYDLADVLARARRDGGGYVLDGEKRLVLGGDAADVFLVSARSGGAQRARDGIGVYRVPRDAKGLTIRSYMTQDGTRAADLTLSSVRVGADALLGDEADALPVIERAVDEAMAALAAEGFGVVAEMQAMTVEYLKTRKQFGVAIGSFQALQHRAADMQVALEQARSMAMVATLVASTDDATERMRLAAAAKAMVGRACQVVGRGAIQLHGGIGITMEYRVGHLFKRATMIDATFGDAQHQLRRLAEAGGLPG